MLFGPSRAIYIYEDTTSKKVGRGDKEDRSVGLQLLFDRVTSREAVLLSYCSNPHPGGFFFTILMTKKKKLDVIFLLFDIEIMFSNIISAPPPPKKNHVLSKKGDQTNKMKR